ncbi:MAG TPA: glycine--tRNA ligase subunit beta [Candidatus Angelobacter sp.]|nr:glycine--tRNA ligase subunit beta [Candidatus Angelobacter sp.]
MPDFLLEIGCEEIPARMLPEATQELGRRVLELLKNNRLQPSGDMACAETPRRLTVIAHGLPSAQPNTQEQLTGPAVKVAFKDGQPTAAVQAFARKAGVDVAKLQKIATPKGEYLAATVTNKGKSARDVLTELLPREIASIYWPKNMYWRAGRPERFVRPVRWIVALLDGEIIPLEFGGIKADKESRGHRILGPARSTISLPSSYVESMRSAHVIVTPQEREQRIRKALDAATRTVPGARWREDTELLKTVVNLTEWPSAILGNFDGQFLSLPEEVLVTVMRDHQKYFAVEDASHKLAPHFLAVLNTDGDPDGLIRHGNERVLRARFNDARFFWDSDQKIPLKDRLEMLKAVTFQKDLGSRYAKAERVTALITSLTSVVSKPGAQIDPEAARVAGRLAQTDLTTELVKEFTELQGIVGGLYAQAQALPRSIADAIYDQYKPVSMEDSVPRTLEGAVLSIADKADTIAGMFALGMLPSGSKDPFALRRQANGIVKIMAEHKLGITLSSLLADAMAGYQGSEAEKKFTLRGEAHNQAILTFFRERLEFYLRDILGLAYDVANAALAAGADDVVDVVARATAVAKVRPSADFEAISTSFKRMKNILRQAQETKKRAAHPFNPALLQEDAEKKLAAEIPKVAHKVNSLRADKQYEQALLEISRLRPVIDTFFDKVMVMVENEELRAQRLGLLQTLVDEFSSIADFSEIVTEKK